jgi:hypothetical protein
MFIKIKKLCRIRTLMQVRKHVEVKRYRDDGIMQFNTKIQKKKGKLRDFFGSL